MIALIGYRPHLWAQAGKVLKDNGTVTLLNQVCQSPHVLVPGIYRSALVPLVLQ